MTTHKAIFHHEQSEWGRRDDNIYILHMWSIDKSWKYSKWLRGSKVIQQNVKDLIVIDHHQTEKSNVEATVYLSQVRTLLSRSSNVWECPQLCRKWLGRTLSLGWDREDQVKINIWTNTLWVQGSMQYQLYKLNLHL